MEAYCMKCRKKVEIKNPKQVTMKNGKPGVYIRSVALECLNGEELEPALPSPKSS